MTKTKQIKKNLKLSEQLLNYLASNPTDAPGKKAGNVSYVVISKDDKELNKLNYNLIVGLQDEGKTVIKAEQTQDKKQPWIFTQA